MKNYIEKFEPLYTIPFASYIWFCNDQNYYFNKYSNKISEVYDFLKKTNTSPIVLYPGDNWSIKSPYFDSLKSVKKYMIDYEKIREFELTTFNKIDLNDLKKSAQKFIDRSKRINSKVKLKLYKPLRMYLIDHESFFTFSFNKGLRKIESLKKVDISFQSQNLKYCFDFMWGFDTILVSGTYQKPEGGNFQRFLELQWIAHQNNIGKKINLFNLK